MNLDDFIKHKRINVEYLPDYTLKTDYLYDTHLFAQKNDLTPQTLSEAYAIITKHILQKSKQGKFRTGNMFVITDDEKIKKQSMVSSIRKILLRQSSNLLQQH
jgi:retron-type reverse transcriptase